MSDIPEFHVRTMSIDDLAAVYHMGNRIYAKGGHLMLYRTWDPYEVTALFNTDAETCLVAEHDDEIIGFALGTIIEKGTAWSYGYIIWLGIAEGWRGMRVGHRLLRILEKRMCDEGVRMFLVDTAAENESAIGFFRREGFELSSPHVYLSKTLSGTAEERKRHANRLVAASMKPRQTTNVGGDESDDIPPSKRDRTQTKPASSKKAKKPKKPKKPRKAKKSKKPKKPKRAKAAAEASIKKPSKTTKRRSTKTKASKKR